MVTQQPLAIPKPPPRWWLRITLALVLAGALVAGGLWAYQHFLVRCADGVARTGPADECIGVTDGAYVFHPDLAEVTGLIREENRRVEDSGEPWVSIAYFEPMTLGKGDKGTSSIEQELQGAYVAQRALNADGEVPKVKLLLANPGEGSKQWRTVVSAILERTDDENPVVAVAGFGQSRKTTLSAVKALNGEHVPMVGSTVTADALSEQGAPYFFRAVSPNSVQAQAVARHLRRQQDSDEGLTVMVIKDLTGHDIYSRSLLAGFMDAAADPDVGLEVDPTELRYWSGEQGIHNTMDVVARRVCEKAEEGRGPHAVYFAGRGRDLNTFIRAAGEIGGTCPLTVYTGDDAVGMFFDAQPGSEAYDRFLAAWEDSGITVEYTALAHPDAAAGMGPTKALYQKFEERYTGSAGKDYPHLGPESELLNGQAMLGHDAVGLLGEAVQASPDGNDPVNTSSVFHAFATFTDEEPFHGVSGDIGFVSDVRTGDILGDPHKKLPLVSLAPTATGRRPDRGETTGEGTACARDETASPQGMHQSVCEVVLPAVPADGETD